MNESNRLRAPLDSHLEIQLACEALQQIKRQLDNIAKVGGSGAPTAGLLLAAVDDCAEAVIVSNSNAEIEMVNGAAARLMGMSTRELKSVTLWDIADPRSQGDFDVLWKAFLRAGRQRGTYSVHHRDGQSVEVAYCSEANILPDHHVSVLRRWSGK